MDDGNTRDIRCPQVNCKHKISYEEVLQVTDAATRKKFEEFVRRSKERKKSKIFFLTLVVAASASDPERRRLGGLVSKARMRHGHVRAGKYVLFLSVL